MAGYSYRRYPWAEWFSGSTQVELKKGRDFSGRTDTMIQQVRNAATKWGVRVSFDVGEDGLSFSFRAEKKVRPGP